MNKHANLLRFLAVLWAGPLLLGCHAHPSCNDLYLKLRAYEKSSHRDKLLLVKVVYETVEGARGLRIEQAKIAPGRPPLLIDDPALAGRVELLDKQGSVVMSASYRPGDTPNGSQATPDAPSKSRMVLRVPYHTSARRVRLTEPGTKMSAKADIVNRSASAREKYAVEADDGH